MALILACGVAASLPAAADGAHEREGEHDQDRAFQALQRGEILPLDKLLAGLLASHPGELIGVELERRNDRWIYELRLIDGSGRLIDLDVDARTGAVLRPEDE